MITEPTKTMDNQPPLLYRILGRLLGKRLFRIFCRLGMLFYNKLAIRHDGRTAFFAHTEWDMVQAMHEYLDREVDPDEVIHPDKLDEALKETGAKPNNEHRPD